MKVVKYVCRMSVRFRSVLECFNYSEQAFTGWRALRDKSTRFADRSYCSVYKRGADSDICRIVFRLIPISATLPAKPIEDSLRFHWVTLHWFDLSHTAGEKFLDKSLSKQKLLARTKGVSLLRFWKIHLPNIWESQKS